MEQITIDQFQKIDIRVGTVIDAIVPEWSHWVMKLTVDFGEVIGTRTIFSGIMKFYQPEDVKGKQFAFVVNLEPKKIGPDRELSEGMLIAASVPLEGDPESNERPILIPLSEPVPNGSKVL